jgi:hypothetical protein
LLPSQLGSAVPLDVVSWMEARGKRYGYRLWDEDDPEVVWSLAELTQWYITAHELRPVSCWVVTPIAECACKSLRLMEMGIEPVTGCVAPFPLYGCSLLLGINCWSDVQQSNRCWVRV